MIKSVFNSTLALFGRAMVSAAVLERINAAKKVDATLTKAIEDANLQLIRHQIRSKWDTIDYIESRDSNPEDSVVCPLCDKRALMKDLRQMEADCIFEGGRLRRFQCSGCDLVFGPLKMLQLTPAQLSHEYEWHYRVFEEGDSTEAEVRAFHLLRPERAGSYLNYGTGSWSKTLGRLNTEGWNVVGYEPHSSATADTTGTITTREALSKLRFDGIFSNNVLEHLRYPVEELDFLASLLNPGGLMAHATPCYEYMYEYTRFHLFFYLGRSRELLAEKANLRIDDYVTDGEFMCTVLMRNQ